MKRQGPRKPSSSPLCSPSPSDPALSQPPGWQFQMQALPCLCLPGTLHGSSVSHRITNHLLTWQPWVQPSTCAFPAEFSSRGPQPLCVPRGWSPKPGAVQGQLSLLRAGHSPCWDGHVCPLSTLAGLLLLHVLSLSICSVLGARALRSGPLPHLGTPCRAWHGVWESTGTSRLIVAAATADGGVS